MSDQSQDTEYCAGRVKWFNHEKGYGFISLPGGGLDVFIHANQLRKSGIERALTDGEQVKFQTAKGDRGSYAVNISVDAPVALPKDEQNAQIV